MLKAGYLEDGRWNATLSGAQQGGVILLPEQADYLVCRAHGFLADRPHSRSGPLGELADAVRGVPRELAEYGVGGREEGTGLLGAARVGQGEGEPVVLLGDEAAEVDLLPVAQ